MTTERSGRVRPMMRRAVWRTADLVAAPTSSLRLLPDYLVIGAQRSGTTSLQQVLAQHPDVSPPRLKKGVHYFDTAYDRGPDWYRSQFQLAGRDKRRRIRHGRGRLSGEASPYYLFHPAVPERIHHLLPDVKLIALLRNPVDRAISHHKHEVRRGYETRPLLEALRAEEERLQGQEQLLMTSPGAVSFTHQHHSYVSRGLYATQLERYHAVLSPENLLVLESEEFWEHPASTLSVVLDFLGLVQWQPQGFPQANATRPGETPPEVARFLDEAFADANRELATLLGRRYRWM